MKIDSKEWFKQSEYDFETAIAMLDSGRYIYSVFMCHLSIEKSLKGLYIECFKEIPPKSHNLIYFLDKLKIELPEENNKFVTLLNDQAIATRYPESLDMLSSKFSKSSTKLIIQKTKGILEWINSQSKQ